MSEEDTKAKIVPLEERRKRLKSLDEFERPPLPVFDPEPKRRSIGAVPIVLVGLGVGGLAGWLLFALVR